MLTTATTARPEASLTMGFWARFWPFAKADTNNSAPATALDSLRRVHVALVGAKIPHAIIGGLALGALGVPRMTKDVDLLVDADDAANVAAIMMALGFSRLDANETFSSFVFDVYMRVDFLHARRQRTRTMLREARVVRFQGHEMLVVRPEDFIGLKLQAIKNRPSHSSDRSDIERIVDHYGGQLDVARIRDYCTVLELPHELENIIARIDAATAGR